uniref:Uncharacterized protein n=1 Tax=Neogobius melanostomus TaxID=47308 RepID=A0A8C6TZA3_9GOBI
INGLRSHTHYIFVCFSADHTKWIRVPVMPQPCQHKSEALQFILYIFCGVMYDLNRILSCISFMVSHSSSVIFVWQLSPHQRYSFCFT